MYASMLLHFERGKHCLLFVAACNSLCFFSLFSGSSFVQFVAAAFFHSVCCSVACILVIWTHQVQNKYNIECSFSTGFLFKSVTLFNFVANRYARNDLDFRFSTHKLVRATQCMHAHEPGIFFETQFSINVYFQWRVCVCVCGFFSLYFSIRMKNTKGKLTRKKKPNVDNKNQKLILCHCHLKLGSIFSKFKMAKWFPLFTLNEFWTQPQE